MSQYTSLVEWYSPHPVRGRYTTTKEVKWEIGATGSGAWLCVPASFDFDVSVPRLTQWAFDPNDERFLKAACLHDYALLLGWSRTSAAGPFADALTAEGVPPFTRFLMVAAVITWHWS
mgnify:CR=1 FL=1